MLGIVIAVAGCGAGVPALSTEMSTSAVPAALRTPRKWYSAPVAPELTVTSAESPASETVSPTAAVVGAVPWMTAVTTWSVRIDALQV